MTDILENVCVEVDCDQCGNFAVGADVIAESQRLLEEGCPGSPYECPPTVLSTLLDQSSLEALGRAWRNLETAARSPVRRIFLDDSFRVPVHAGRDADPRAVSRWEDDGGYVPATPRGASSAREDHA